MHRKMNRAFALVSTVLVLAGCTHRPAPSALDWEQSARSTRSAAPGKAVGEPVRDVVDAARRDGMDCAQVDDQPLMVWECHQTAGRMVVSVELISTDRAALSLFTLVASNGLDGGNEDPLPHIVDFATVILPASYPGKEGENMLKWAADGGTSTTTELGPISGSMMGNDRFLNLTVYFEQFDLPSSSDIFDEFHVDDAKTWGESAGLECSQGVLDPQIGGFEKVRCMPPSGPRAAIDFMLAFDDSPAPGDFSDTDIVLGVGRCMSAEPGSKEALADIVASLVQRLSGSSDDAARARTWILTYVGANVDSYIGTLNARLTVSPDDTDPVMGDQIKVNPIGYRAQ